MSDVSVNNQADRAKYTSIEQWGTAVWNADMSNAFRGASSLIMTATDTPNMSAVTTMKNMFSGATSFTGAIGGWNVVAVTDMSGMFSGATSFTGAIGGWNVEAVTDMSNMFNMLGATPVFNQDIGGWNTASVMNMSNMFFGATSFDQNIGGWNVEAVTIMQNMFRFVSLSPTNYDALLEGWNRQNLRPSVLSTEEILNIAQMQHTPLGKT